MSIKKIYRNLTDSTLTVFKNNNTIQNIIQLIVLDFDGAEDVSYTNPDVNVSVNDINVKATVSAEDQQTILQQLNGNALQGVLYISSSELEETEMEEGTQYSTIYVGDTDAFEPIGTFSGIAETTGASAEAKKNDNAFVITNGLTAPEAIVAVIEHEAGHLMGTVTHDHGNDGATLDDNMAFFCVHVRSGQSSCASYQYFSYPGGVWHVLSGGTLTGEAYYSANSNAITVNEGGVLRHAGQFYKNRGYFVHNSGSALITYEDISENSGSNVVINYGTFLFSNKGDYRNYATFYSNIASNVKGAAVFNYGSMTFDIGMAGFSCNRTTDWGGAICNCGTLTFYTQSGNYFDWNSANYGAAIATIGENGCSAITTLSGKNTFDNNSARRGGALATASNADVRVIGTNSFTWNNASYEGGAGYFAGGSATFDGANVFSHNSAGSNGGGLFVKDDATVTLTNGNYFESNIARRGGALYNGGTLNIWDNNSFVANNGEGGMLNNWGTTFFSGSTWVSANYGGNGGAIVNQGTVTITAADSGVNTFIGNYATERGGVIYNSSNTVTIDAVETGKNIFSGNWANQAGAIINMAEATLNISAAQFIDNTATLDGGAIWNFGAMNLSNVSFESNRASWGGAVNNTRSVGIHGSTTFNDNKASEGGAIYNTGNNAVLTLGGEATDINTFSGNMASRGGAIYNTNSMTISGSANRFESNSAIITGAIEDVVGGAIYNGSGATLSIVAEPEGFNEFIGNSATHYAGAIMTRASASTTVSGSNTFASNIANWGGALCIDGRVTLEGGNTFSKNNANVNGGAIMNNSGGVLTISATSGNNVFAKNMAVSKGGALYATRANTYFSTIMGINNVFTSNSAQFGGAIFVDGGKMELAGAFYNNKATSRGGAIYNAGGGNINLMSDTAFSGNAVTASGGQGGAIYNENGTITIHGVLTLATQTDTIYNTNSGKLVWDLSAGENAVATVTDFELIQGNGTLSITVQAEAMTVGTTYTLAKNFTADDVTFVMNDEVKIRLGADKRIQYGSNYYSLSRTTDNNLILRVEIDPTKEPDQFVVAVNTSVNMRTYEPEVKRPTSPYCVNYKQQGYNAYGAIVNYGILTGQYDASSVLRIVENTSLKGGGALYNVKKPGSTSATSANLAYISFEKNKATIESAYGGAIYNSDAVVTLSETSFLSNTAIGSGGAIYNAEGLVELEGTRGSGIWFSGNSAAVAGGVYNNDKMTFSGITTFVSNAADQEGAGAMFNAGSIMMIGSNIFDHNVVTDPYSYFSGQGGAVHNGGGTLEMSSYNKFVGNSACHAGALYNANGENGTMGTATLNGTNIFSKNIAEYGGGAIFTEEGIVTVSGNNSFQGNSATGKGDFGGGAIYVGSGTVNLLGSNTFVKNQAGGRGGGAIFNSNGTINISGNTTIFRSNIGDDWGGGAIYNSIGTVDINGTTLFEGNRANTYGGAIYNEDVLMLSGNNTFSRNQAVNGGAINNEKNPEAPGTSGTMIVDGLNIFADNVATSNGGAIANDGGIMTFSGMDADDRNTFIGNKAINGGAIYNFSGGMMNVWGANNTFSGNIATANGGAVYNEFDSGFSSISLATVRSVSFNQNSAAGKGGAMYNNGDLLLWDDNFSGNSAAQGGAVYHAGGKMEIIGDITLETEGDTIENYGTLNWNLMSKYNFQGYDMELAGYATISNYSLLNNHTDNGAELSITVEPTQAIKTYTLAHHAGDVTGKDVFAIKGLADPNVSLTVNGLGYVDLENSRAYTLITTDSQDLNLNVTAVTVNTTTRFTVEAGEASNLTTGSIHILPAYTREDGGAVISNGGTVNGYEQRFIGNAAIYDGGVIMNSGTISLNTVQFTDNRTAAHGGAVYNQSNGVLKLKSAIFSGNYAALEAGAIYNAGNMMLQDGTFRGNRAANGGAVYNATGALLSMTGTINLVSETDTLVNGGTLNWDLTHTTATVSDYSLVTNTGNLTITVTPTHSVTTYVLAENAIGTLEGKDTFTLYGTDKTEGVTLTVGANSSYVDWTNRQVYNLAVNSSNELTLSVTNVDEHTIQRLVVTEGESYELPVGSVYTLPEYTGSDGGGVLLNAGTVSGNYVKFNSNTVAYFGGAVMNQGKLTLSHTEFNGNMADMNGGAMYNEGEVNLFQVTFTENIAKLGGAIFNKGTLNLMGAVTLSTMSDTLVNTGTLNWDLTEANAYLSDYSLLKNNGTLSITVNDDIAFNTYLLADNVNSLNGKNIFTLNGLVLQSGITLTVNETVFINGLTNKAYMVVQSMTNQLLLIVGQQVEQPSTGHILVSAGNAYDVAANGIYSLGTYTGSVGGGAILNNGTVTGGGAMFVNNGATANGGAIVNNADMTLSSTKFFNNSATNGGAVYNNGTAFLSGGKFRNNTAAIQGGAIGNFGSMTLQDVSFYGNDAEQGGAVCNNGQLNLQGTISLLRDTDTIYNAGTLNWNLAAGDVTVNDYSLVMNDAELGKLTITVAGDQAYGTYILAENAVTVEGKNTFTLMSGKEELTTLTVNGAGYVDVTSGRAYILDTTAENQLALHVGQLKTGLSRLVVESGQSYNLAENENYTYPTVSVEEGGAILNRGTLTGSGALFMNNNASVAGGALYNSGTMNVANLEFLANSATSNGGAILNNGSATLNGASFRGNSVLSGNGGAIYNQGTMNIAGVISLGTETDTIYNVNDAKMNWVLTTGQATISNYTLVTNQGELDITMDFEKTSGSYVLAENACGDLSGKNTFSLMGTDATISVGGFLAYSNKQIYTIQVNTDKELVLEHGTAKTGTTHMVVDDKEKNVLSAGAFYSYAPYTGEDGGGALLNNGEVGGISATFLDNRAAYDGGAIVNNGEMTLLRDKFYGNSAASAGGALYNTGYLYLGDVEFIGNTAANGGAIYNAENATTYIIGAIDLATSTDTLVNAGTFNWRLDLNVDNFDYSISDYTLLRNMGTLAITVDGEQTLGTYVLADNAELTDGKYVYNLLSSASSFSEQTLELSETGMDSYVDNVYNRVYTLSVRDGHKLVLDVTEGDLETRKVVISGTEYAVTPGVHRSPLDEGGNGGGSIHVDDGGILTGCGAETRAVFNSNGTTTEGGAIWNAGATTLSNTDFIGNYANANGGAVYNSAKATLELTNTALNGNNASGQGGAIYNAGTAILGRVSFSGNNAKMNGGGAVYNANGGTLRLVGTIGLESDGDTLVNNGILDWNLTNGTYKSTDYAISDWTRVTNNGTLFITVGAEGPTIKESTGLTEYVLAHNAAGFNSSITVRGAGADTALTVDGDVQGIAYGGKLYHLEKASTDSSTDLVLSVSNTNIDLKLVTKFNGEVVKFKESDGYAWLAKEADVTIEASTGNVDNLTYTLNNGEVIQYTEAIKVDTTSAETWTYAFTGTSAQSASIITAEMMKFKVDATAPDITVTIYVPEGYSDIAIVSATFSDTGSGIDSMLYSYDGSEWFNYTGSFSVQKNQLADGETIYIKATDIAGNVTSRTEKIQGLVDVGIVLLTNNETLTSSTELVAYALSDDESTTISAFEWRYGECGIWQNLATNERSFLDVLRNGTYYFRATDSNGKVWTHDVTYSNLEVVPDDKTQKLTLNNENFVTEEGTTIYARSVTVNNGTLTLAKDSALYAGVLTLNGSTLNAEEGDIIVENVIISGTGNAFTGELFRQDKNATFKVEKDSNLALSLEQYNELLTWRSFNVDGSIQVSGDATDALSQSDIKAIVNCNTIRHVDFGDMALVNFNTLAFNSNESASIRFGDATGSYKADSISVVKGAVIELGSEGKTIDMLEGNDTVAIQANASLNMYSDLKNVSTISIAKGTMTTKLVTDSSLKSSKISVQHYTVARFADIAFDDERGGALNLGSFNDVIAESVTGDASKSNKITVGNNSVAKFGTISEVSTITVAAGTEYKEHSTDVVKTRGITEFNGGLYTGAARFSDKIRTNSFTDVTFGRINFATDGFVRTYDETIPTKVISATTTRNSLAVARNAIRVGGKAYFAVKGDVEAVNSLATGNGAAATSKTDEVRTVVDIAGNITGTANNDSLKFGNYNTVTIGTYENDMLKEETGIINFTMSTVETIETTDEKGNATKMTIYTPISTNDTLSIGNYTTFQSGMIDFGAGSNTFTVGKATTVTTGDLSNANGTMTLSVGATSDVTVGAISNVSKLTISNGSYDSKIAVTNWTSFAQAGVITGTSGKDSLSFGNYVIATVGDMNLNVGNDTITFGTNSQVTINSLTLHSTESLTIKGGFSTAATVKTISSQSGPSTLTLASKARLDVGTFVGDTTAYSNIKVSMGANSELRIVGEKDAISGLNRIYTVNGKTAATVAVSNELVTGAGSIASLISSESALKVVALGTQGIAANFTDTRLEVADNNYKSTTAKLTEGYNGWLASGTVSDQSYFEDGSDSFELVKNSSSSFDLSGWQVQFGENVDSSKSASDSLCVIVRTKEGNVWSQKEIFADENGIYNLDVATVSSQTSAVRVSVDLKDSNTAVSYKIGRDLLLA